jgi:hypothetical protein
VDGKGLSVNRLWTLLDAVFAIQGLVCGQRLVDLGPVCRGVPFVAISFSPVRRVDVGVGRRGAFVVSFVTAAGQDTPLGMPPIPAQQTQAVDGILSQEGAAAACVVAHSYGTAVASRLLQSRPDRVAHLCLIDPVGGAAGPCIKPHPHPQHSRARRARLTPFQNPWHGTCSGYTEAAMCDLTHQLRATKPARD